MSATEPDIEDPFGFDGENCVYHALNASIAAGPPTSDDGKFSNAANVDAEWPDRLLHLRTSTSYTLNTKDMSYNGVRKPDFAVISYKWGLHVVDGASNWRIKGITWKVPKLDAAYLSVSQVQKLMAMLAETFEFAWIDVACIDQYLTDETRQIIVEPQYFKQATKCFAWFVSFTAAELTPLFDDIYLAVMSIKQLDKNMEDGNDLEKIPAAIARAIDSLETLLADDWFSSNWTLREIMLCRGVTVLDKAADVVPVAAIKHQPAQVDAVASLCNLILRWLARVELALNAAQTTADQMRILEHNISDGPIPVPSASLARRAAGTPFKTRHVIIEALKLIEHCGAFFLFACNPAALRYWTRALLETGKLVDQHLAGKDGHTGNCTSRNESKYHAEEEPDNLYHGWGNLYAIECSCWRLCKCKGTSRHHGDACQRWYFQSGPKEPEHVMCIPCVLGISFEGRQGMVNAHTNISNDVPESDLLPSSLGL